MASCVSVFVLVFIVGAGVVGVISFSSPFWVESNDHTLNRTITWGLWERCSNNGNRSCRYFDHVIIPGWFHAVRTLFSISLAGGLLAFFINISYLCCKPCRNSTVTVQVGIGALMAAFVCGLLAITVFGIKEHDTDLVNVQGNVRFAWSYYLGLISTAGFLLAMILSICEMSNTRRLAVYQPIK